MASVDTHYSAALPTLMPDQSVAGGTSAQPGLAGNKPDADIDWFSSAQAAEYHPITIRANAAATGEATLDALAGAILSRIGEYTPD